VSSMAATPVCAAKQSQSSSVANTDAASAASETERTHLREGAGDSGWLRTHVLWRTTP
jgi:hypothetical protein